MCIQMDWAQDRMFTLIAFELLVWIEQVVGPYKTYRKIFSHTKLPG